MARDDFEFETSCRSAEPGIAVYSSAVAERLGRCALAIGSKEIVPDEHEQGQGEQENPQGSTLLSFGSCEILDLDDEAIDRQQPSEEAVELNLKFPSLPTISERVVESDSSSGASQVPLACVSPSTSMPQSPVSSACVSKKVPVPSYLQLWLAADAAAEAESAGTPGATNPERSSEAAVPKSPSAPLSPKVPKSPRTAPGIPRPGGSFSRPPPASSSSSGPSAVSPKPITRRHRRCASQESFCFSTAAAAAPAPVPWGSPLRAEKAGVGLPSGGLPLSPKSPYRERIGSTVFGGFGDVSPVAGFGEQSPLRDGTVGAAPASMGGVRAAGRQRRSGAHHRSKSWHDVSCFDPNSASVRTSPVSRTGANACSSMLLRCPSLSSSVMQVAADKAKAKVSGSGGSSADASGESCDSPQSIGSSVVTASDDGVASAKPLL